MKNFSIQFGGLEGQHVTEHRLPLCLISHFLYSSERVLTLKDVPSTLARSLVEVIAQHTNQKAKLKKRKQQQQKLWVFIVYYHLLNHEVFPYCPVVFQAISVGSKKKKSDFLICWNIIYVRFEKVVMAWVWVAGEASPGEFSLAGGVFFVVTTDKSRRHVLSDSAGAVSMFSPVVNWTFLLKKKTLKKLGKVSRPTCIFHVKISGLLPNQLKTYPFPLKEKKISFMLVFFFFFLTRWIRISYLKVFFFLKVY